jgi:hypothetical protein
MGPYISGIASTYEDGDTEGVDMLDIEKSKYIRVPLKSYHERQNRIDELMTEIIEKNNKIFELGAEVVSLKLLLDHATERLEALENYHTLVLDYKELLERVLESEGRLLFK